MAGNQNSGGFRPTAPQNNPANISATGGNGQSGRGTQAPKYIPGMGYGQGQATMAQQKGAAMAGPTPAPSPLPVGTVGPVPSLDQPSLRPNEPVTAGAAMGPGPGPEALTMPGDIAATNDPDIDLVRQYFPMIELWAQQVDTSQGTKDYVNYLRTIL